jgi:putative CocE/NonD family hydrolase
LAVAYVENPTRATAFSYIDTPTRCAKGCLVTVMDDDALVMAAQNVKVTYDVRVPMSDGVGLAANLYLPDAQGPFPAILTYIPYLKDGYGGLGYMDYYQRHFASRGYAVVQLDFRGVGSSEGVNPYPFDPRERDDAHEAVEWISEQLWCTGSVGMWGVSYGGITAIATATTRPPHLKAIIPVHASDDNWSAMFVHRGSRLMLLADPHWGPGMTASNLLPPLRADGSPDWIERWYERLEGNTPWHLAWHGQPPTPDFLERQKADPNLIEIPMLGICGWQDAYPEDMFRVFSAARGPKKILAGPWKHTSPDQSPVEPINHMAEMDRWWDRWLKGAQNGVESDPPVTIYVQGTGRWRNEQEWPILRAQQDTLFAVADGSLAEETPGGSPRSDVYDYDARIGLASAAYDSVLEPIEYPADQTSDDLGSLRYDSGPLPEPVEVTGQPSVTLFFSTDAPLEEVDLVAKLLDVTPDGHSYLVSFDSLQASQATLADRFDDRDVYAATIPLRPTSYEFGVGHRMRLCVSGANFPAIWPAPRRFSLSVYSGGQYATELALPTVPAQVPVLPSPRLGVLTEPATQNGAVRDSGTAYSVTHDLVTRKSALHGARWVKLQVEPHTQLSSHVEFDLTVDADHPDRANTSTSAVAKLDRPTGAVEVRVNTETTLHSLSIRAEIDLDGRPFWERRWQKRW